MKKKSKIQKKSTYKVDWIIYEDGSSSLNRTCKGFNAFELLGIVELLSREIKEQIEGTIKPDIIKRKVIE